MDEHASNDHDADQLRFKVMETLTTLGMSQHCERFMRLLLQADIRSVEGFKQLDEYRCQQLRLPFDLVLPVQKRIQAWQQESNDRVARQLEESEQHYSASLGRSTPGERLSGSIAGVTAQFGTPDDCDILDSRERVGGVVGTPGRELADGVMKSFSPTSVLAASDTEDLNRLAKERLAPMSMFGSSDAEDLNRLVRERLAAEQSLQKPKPLESAESRTRSYEAIGGPIQRSSETNRRSQSREHPLPRRQTSGESTMGSLDARLQRIEDFLDQRLQKLEDCVDRRLQTIEESTHQMKEAMQEAMQDRFQHVQESVQHVQESVQHVQESVQHMQESTGQSHQAMQEQILHIEESSSQMHQAMRDTDQALRAHIQQFQESTTQVQSQHGQIVQHLQQLLQRSQTLATQPLSELGADLVTALQQSNLGAGAAAAQRLEDQLAKALSKMEMQWQQQQQFHAMVSKNVEEWLERASMQGCDRSMASKQDSDFEQASATVNMNGMGGMSCPSGAPSISAQSGMQQGIHPMCINGNGAPSPMQGPAGTQAVPMHAMNGMNMMGGNGSPGGASNAGVQGMMANGTAHSPTGQGVGGLPSHTHVNGGPANMGCMGGMNGAGCSSAGNGPCGARYGSKNGMSAQFGHGGMNGTNGGGAVESSVGVAQDAEWPAQGCGNARSPPQSQGHASGGMVADAERARESNSSQYSSSTAQALKALEFERQSHRSAMSALDSARRPSEGGHGNLSPQAHHWGDGPLSVRQRPPSAPSKMRSSQRGFQHGGRGYHVSEFGGHGQFPALPCGA